MSERIYGWLLRLYPSSFRQAYGEEALQLFRDRWRDERAPVARVRLWCDVLADVALSAPREWRYGSAAVVVAQGQLAWDGFPSFRMLDAETPSFRSLFHGGVAAVVVYGSLLALVNRGENALLVRVDATEPEKAYSASATRALQPTTPDGRTAEPPSIVRMTQSAAGVAAGSMADRTATAFAVQIRPIPTRDMDFFGGLTSFNGHKLGSVMVEGEIPWFGTRDIKGIYIGGSVGSMKGGKRDAVHDQIHEQEAVGVSSRPRTEAVARDNHRTAVRGVRHRARASHRVHRRSAAHGRGRKAAHIRGRIYSA